MAGNNCSSGRPTAARAWLAWWVVVALLVAGFAGISHTGHAHEPAHQLSCVACLLSHGGVMADGVGGRLTLFVLAGFLLVFRAEVRSVCLVRHTQPLGRGPPA